MNFILAPGLIAYVFVINVIKSNVAFICSNGRKQPA